MEDLYRFILVFCLSSIKSGRYGHKKLIQLERFSSTSSKCRSFSFITWNQTFYQSFCSVWKRFSSQHGAQSPPKERDRKASSRLRKNRKEEKTTREKVATWTLVSQRCSVARERRRDGASSGSRSRGGRLSRPSNAFEEEEKLEARKQRTYHL